MAEQELGKALEGNPNFAEAIELFAVCRMERGDAAVAHRCARRVIELAPTWPEAYVRHAWTILRDASYVPPGTTDWQIVNRSRKKDPRTQELMRLLNEALRLDPRRSYTWYLFAIAWMEMSEFEQGLDAAEEGLSLAPNDVDLLDVRARALARLGRTDEAAQTTQTALAIDPQYAPSFNRRGVVLLQAGQFDEARDCLVEAVRLDPRDAAARAALFDAMQTEHALFRWAFRLTAPLTRRGWVPAEVAFYTGIALLVVAGVLMAVFDPPRRMREAVVDIALIFIIGVPLLITWLRQLGRFVLSFHPRARHLVPVQARAFSHALLYGIPTLLLIPICQRCHLPGGVVVAALLTCLPLGVATSQDRPAYRLGFLAYAALFFGVACAIVTVWQPSPRDDSWPMVVVSAFIAAGAPLVVLDWLQRRAAQP